MKDILIVVDMQNDFIDGVLGNKETKEIVPKIANLIKNFSGDVVFTQDTHKSFVYAKTVEGKNIPMHCNFNTDGWNVSNELLEACKHNKNVKSYNVFKYSFGYDSWLEFFADKEIEFFDFPNSVDTRYKNIYVVGTCTDICVIANVLGLRSTLTLNPIIVYENLCTGTSIENHNAALQVMKSCLTQVEKYGE